MQTGPRRNQSMGSWLVMTGIVELICVFLFSYLVWSLSNHFGNDIGFLSLIGIITLNVILIQGGIYWLLKKYKPITLTPSRQLRFIQGLYFFNTLILSVFPISFLLWLFSPKFSTTNADMLIGLGCYLFGVGEFVHYFVWKINMRPKELKNAIRNKRFVSARMRRELSRARKQARPIKA